MFFSSAFLHLLLHVSDNLVFCNIILNQGAPSFIGTHIDPFVLSNMRFW